MPVRTNFMERTGFYTLNAAPGVMLDLAGMMAYQAVATALDLGLFQEMASGPATAADLALKLDAQERGVRAILLALAALGYADEKGGRYSNSKMTEKWLLDPEAFDANALFDFWNDAGRDLMPHLADVIRSGTRPFEFYKCVWSEPGRAKAYQRTLMTNARLSGPDVVQKLALPDGEARLLDVGGGHGTHTILMCQRYPRLQATILDNYAGLETAQEEIARHNLQERVTLQKGDLWQADWGADFDMIFLFNVIHHFDQETGTALLRKAHVALKAGGTVVVLDQIAGQIRGAAINAVIRLVALQYYLLADGHIFSTDDLSQMSERAGFTNIQFHKLSRLPGNGLMTAVRP